MPEDPKPIPQTVAFEYLKSNYFRVVHADGAYVASRSASELTVTFFSDRQPIPRRVVHSVQPDGKIGDEIQDERVVRDALVRDTEVSVNMNLNTVNELIVLLQRIVKETEEQAKRRQVSE